MPNGPVCIHISKETEMKLALKPTKGGEVLKPSNGLITLFARKELTQDPIDKRYFSRKKDTVLYRDALCTDCVSTWPWHNSNCPRRNSKTVVLNCWRWSLQWIPADPASLAKSS